MEAVRELGPVGGWRCADGGPYVYDPRRERADLGVLSEAPEAIARGVEVLALTLARLAGTEDGIHGAGNHAR